jgi:uncharacterized RDD family membrane protein YckC
MIISISRDGLEIGEWTEAQVRTFYKNGQLLPTDHYWKEGMTEWASLNTFVKPPLPPPKEALRKVEVLTREENEGATNGKPFITTDEPEIVQAEPSFPNGYTQAGYKMRCAARIIDMAFVSFIAQVLDLPMLWTAYSAFGSDLPTTDSNWGVQIFCKYAGTYVVFCCTFFAWETFWIRVFGTSIGKILFGLRVVSLTRTRIKAWRALVRSFYLYLSLWLFLVYPVGPAVSAIYLEKKFLKNGTTSWDKKTRMTVIGKRIGWPRKITAVTLCIVSIIFLMYLWYLARQPAS